MHPKFWLYLRARESCLQLLNLPKIPTYRTCWFPNNSVAPRPPSQKKSPKKIVAYEDFTTLWLYYLQPFSHVTYGWTVRWVLGKLGRFERTFGGNEERSENKKNTKRITWHVLLGCKGVISKRNSIGKLSLEYTVKSEKRNEITIIRPYFKRG